MANHPPDWPPCQRGGEIIPGTKEGTHKCTTGKTAQQRAGKGRMDLEKKCAHRVSHRKTTKITQKANKRHERVIHGNPVHGIKPALNHTARCPRHSVGLGLTPPRGVSPRGSDRRRHQGTESLDIPPALSRAPTTGLRNREVARFRTPASRRRRGAPHGAAAAQPVPPSGCIRLTWWW